MDHQCRYYGKWIISLGYGITISETLHYSNFLIDYQDFSNRCRWLRTNWNITYDNYGVCEPNLRTSYIYHVIFTKLSQNDQYSNMLVNDYYYALVRWIPWYIVFQMSVILSVCRQIRFQKITREHLSPHYWNLISMLFVTSRWVKGQGQGPRKGSI